jgi:hypothetical protein
LSSPSIAPVSLTFSRSGIKSSTGRY